MEIKLSKADIKQIIAERFNIKPELVIFDTEETMEGYGTNEHVVHVPVVYLNGLTPGNIIGNPRMGTIYDSITYTDSTIGTPRPAGFTYLDKAVSVEKLEV